VVDLPKACQTTFTVAQNAEVGARNLMDSTQVRQKPSCVCLLVIAARSDCVLNHLRWLLALDSAELCNQQPVLGSIRNEKIWGIGLSSFSRFK